MRFVLIDKQGSISAPVTVNKGKVRPKAGCWTRPVQCPFVVSVEVLLGACNASSSALIKLASWVNAE